MSLLLVVVEEDEADRLDGVREALVTEGGVRVLLLDASTLLMAGVILSLSFLSSFMCLRRFRDHS